MSFVEVTRLRPNSMHGLNRKIPSHNITGGFKMKLDKMSIIDLNDLCYDNNCHITLKPLRLCGGGYPYFATYTHSRPISRLLNDTTVYMDD